MRQAFGQEFDLPLGYLNTASVGVGPQLAVSTLHRTVADWSHGAASAADFDPFVATGRAAYADLVGTTTDRVAFGGSASALIGLVAASVPDGARVVVPNDEFTSATFPFAAQAHRGVTVTEVPLSELVDHAAGADVVVASVVQSADGARLDIEALRAATVGLGTIVVLDVTQAAGWIPLDLGWADAVVAGGYKWLLAPRGVAWMALSPRMVETLVPHAANWYAGASPWDSIYGLPLRLATDARRLDTSPAWWCHVGASITLPWLASLDLRAVEAHCIGLADAVLEGLDLPPQGSAIVSLAARLPHHDAHGPDTLTRLTAAGVKVAGRAGRVRLAFHLYNDESDVAAVLGALR